VSLLLHRLRRGGGIIGGFRGVGNTPLWCPRQRPDLFFLDPILGWSDLPMVLCMIFAHGFGWDGFWSMVLDAMVFSTWYWMLRHV